MKPIVIFRVSIDFNDQGLDWRKLMTALLEIYDPDYKQIPGGRRRFNEDKKLHGCYVIVMPTTTKELDVEVRYDRDVTDIKVEDLKKEIDQLVEKLSAEHE